VGCLKGNIMAMAKSSEPDPPADSEWKDAYCSNVEVKVVEGSGF